MFFHGKRAKQNSGLWMILKKMSIFCMKVSFLQEMHGNQSTRMRLSSRKYHLISFWQDSRVIGMK
eukprot:5815601-Ditylum_brightwellii.AAC.1